MQMDWIIAVRSVKLGVRINQIAVYNIYYSSSNEKTRGDFEKTLALGTNGLA